ncbi:hypothetical protein C8Q74DRAFT_317592 [Fomes fomentarius]|nr:hypothetical protein C8Q74DRAFT_317592 [Fomes fomentarius]
MHLSPRIAKHTFAAFSVVLVANVLFKLFGRLAIDRIRRNESVGPVQWDLDGKEVVLQGDRWTRYPLHDSAQQWAALFPEGGIVHLGTKHTPHTVSMMHQLRCLDVVRDQLTRPRAARDIEPTRHCMNYLRETLMCRGDLQIDPYQYAHKINAVHPHPIRRCKDWRVVYAKVAEYQRAHAVWLEADPE